MEASRSVASPGGTYSQRNPAPPSTSASSSSQQLIPIAALRRASSEQECPYDLNDYPAHRAAWEGDGQKIERLCGIGNRAGPDGLHPVHVAILRNQPEALKALLPFSTDHPVNFETHGQLRLLGLAFIQKNKACVDLILEQEPSALKQAMGQDGGNIVHLAARNGLTNMVYHLLKTHFNATLPLLDRQDANHRTPLSLAAEMGDKAMVEYLWQRGANLEASDRRGRRALHWAAMNSRHNVIQCLALMGADLQALDGAKPRRRPIDYARGEGKTYELLDGLLNKRAFDREQKPTLPKHPLYGVWSGGGLKCIELIGCAKYLHEEGKLQRLVGIGGTSGGAILGSLLAVGYTPEELEGVIQDTTLWQVMDHPKPSASLIEGLKGVARLLKTLTNPWDLIDKTVSRPGILSGEQLRSWLDGLIERKTGHKHCTFKQLRKLIYQNPPGSRRFKHLHIVCTRIGKKRTLFLPNTRDKMWDDFPVSELVAVSGCFPVVFKPIQPRKFEQDIDGGRSLRPVKWSAVDGGILMNCPDRIFDKRGFIQSGLSEINKRRPDYNPHVVAFKLYSPSEQSSEAPQAMSTPLGSWSVYREVQTIRASAEDLLQTSNPYEDARIIRVDNLGLGAFHLTSNSRIQHQIEQGFRIAREAFEGPTSSSANATSTTRNQRRGEAPPDRKGKGKATSTTVNDDVSSNEEEESDPGGAESRQITAITRALLRGNTEPFKQHLPDAIREQALQKYPFGRSAGRDDKVLQAILDVKASFMRLSFSGERQFSLLSLKKLEEVIALSPSLRVLELRRCHDIKGEFLWKLPNLCPHLRELSLVGCSQLKDVWSTRSWLTFPNLESLNLAGSGIQRFHIRAPKLTSFDFSQCSQLTRLSLDVPALKRGKLDGCSNLSIGDLKKIAVNVQNLDLSNNRIGDKGAEVLGKALLTNETLTSLNLSNNRIGYVDAQSPFGTVAVVGSPSAAVITGAIAVAVAACPPVAAVVLAATVRPPVAAAVRPHVVVSGAAVGDVSVLSLRALVKVMQKNRALTILNLSNNRINDFDAQALGQALWENGALTTLNLDNNRVGDGGAEALAKALEHNTNTSLTEFHLGHNEIGDSGAKAFAKALKHNASLKRLDLKHNKIGVKGVFWFSKALKENSTLTNLDLGGNKTGSPTTAAAVFRSIRRSLSRNKERAKAQARAGGASEKGKGKKPKTSSK